LIKIEQQIKLNKGNKMASLKDLMLKKKQQIAQSTGRFAKAVKPKMGTSRWRILPSWRQLEKWERTSADQDIHQFWHDFGQHYIKDQNGELRAVYVCASKTFDKPCQVCETLREGYSKAATDEDKMLIKESFASGRVLVNALDVSSDPTTPVVLELSPTTFDLFLNLYMQNIDPKNEDFNIVTDPNEGLDINITREGTGINTKYSISPVIKGSKAVPSEVLEKMTDLDAYVAQETAQGLIKASQEASKLVHYAGGEAPAISHDAFESEDVPHFESPKPKAKAKVEAKPKAAAPAEDSYDDGVIEGSYEAAAADSDMPEEELNALLEGLDD
jgi:gp32 DNA binding protein like